MKTHRKSRWTAVDVPVALNQPIEALAIVFDPLIIYMRVLALKSSFVLVEWINILAELTLDGRYFNDAEATIDIAHFLSSALKECSEEEGIGAIDIADPLCARIERIKREQLNCFIPFDNQTMDHVGALVGAYLDLSMENYKYSLHQTRRKTSPFAFFIMTTKRLLEDVNVLKKDRENDGHSKKRSRRTGAGEADANENDIDPKRQSSCSTRLSYSSGSSSSSESGQQSSIETSSQTSLLCDIDRESLFSPKNSTERSNAIRKNEKKPLGVIFDAGKGIGESPLVRRGTYGTETWPTYWGDETNQNFQRMKNIQDNRNEEGEVEDVDEDGRRFSTLEKDQSPINTSYETTFTRADTGESSHFTNTSGGLMSTASDVNFGRKKADEKGIREGRDADMHPL